MTLYIGDIPIYYVSSFNVDRGLKNIEEVHFIGSNVVPYLAEHNSKLLDLEISGTLLAESGISATLDDLAERILAIKDRGACFNFIHNFQSRSGWAGLKEGGSDKNAHSLVTRPFNIEGKFLPKNSYQPRMHSHPIILTNDFSLSLGTDGCDNYIPIPIGATYSGGDGSAITRVGKDGTTTLVKANTNNDIKWDLDADEVDVGECKVWDNMNEVSESDWVRVFNPDHVFIGEVVIENGLVRLLLNETTSGFIFYYYDTSSSTWKTISDKSNIHPIRAYNISFDTLSSDHILINTKSSSGKMGGDGGSFTSTFTIMKGMPSIKLVYSAGCGLYTYIGGRFRYLPDSDLPLIDNKMDDSSVDPNYTNIDQQFDTDNYALYILGTDSTALKLFIPSEKANYSTQLRTYDTGVNIEMYDKISSTIFLSGIPFTCSNLFKECEDMTQGAGVTFYTGVDASPKTGNTGSILNAQNENVYYEFTGGTDLPLGTYKLFLRAKDSAQVADDISCLVRNTTDSTDVMAETTKTLTGSWAYYSFDVIIASDDDTDTIRVTLNKETATANTIDLDYVLWVPISLDSGNGPQDIAHQAMVDQRMQRELIQR